MILTHLSSGPSPVGQSPWLRSRRKRIVDIALSGLFLVVFGPLLLLTAIAISIESPGSPLFTQQRIGLMGKPFTILKFRSLLISAAAYSTKLKSDNPLVTRVGRLLRDSGLDELPQLFNVLRGDMSLVGPRPELPFIAAGYEGWQARRLIARPGITGWWQIHHRNDTPMHLNLEYDIHYITCADWKLDFRILVATAKLLMVALWRGLSTGTGSGDGQGEGAELDTVDHPRRDADAEGHLRSR